jgi:hypothetical protein
MRRPAIVLSALALSFLVAQLGIAAAQGTSTPPPAGGVESPIGKVVTLEGSATIEHTAIVVSQVSVASGPTNAKIGDFVYRGDVILTAADSKLGLVFTDGTALNVFSNARMTLDEFVYQPNGKWNSSTFNLVKGTFTFIGGKMVKAGDMRANTPTATLGIRGTTAHVVIGEDGSVRFSTLIEEKE